MQPTTESVAGAKRDANEDRSITMSERNHPGDDLRDSAHGFEPSASREAQDRPEGHDGTAPGFGAGVGGGAQAPPSRQRKRAKKKRSESKASTKRAPSSDAGGDVGGEASRETSKRPQTRKRRTKARPAESGEAVEDNSRRAEAEAENRKADEGAGRPPRRRRKAEPRARAASEEDQDSEVRSEAAPVPPSTEGESPRPRSKKSSTKRRRRGGAARSEERDDEAQSSADEGERSESDEGASRRPSRAKSAKRSKRQPRHHDDEDAVDERSAESDSEENTDEPKRRRKRGSRGGRRRKQGATSDAAEIDVIPGESDDLPRSESAEASSDSEPARKKARRSRSRGGAKDGARREAPEDERSDDERDDAGDEAPVKKKTRRGGRGRKSASRVDDDRDQGAEESGGKKKRSRSRKMFKDDDDDEVVVAEVTRDRLILVNADDKEEKRVAVVADNKIIDFQMNAESQKSLVNDIYRGRVVNLEPAIGAAFIDFGQGRNGFLHTSDVLGVYGEKGFTLESLLTATEDEDDWEGNSHPGSMVETDDDPEDASSKKGGRSEGKGRTGGARRRMRKRLPITELVRMGDQVVVQITKDAIGDKGPTVTTYSSIPGRYLVLMPSMARNGVSRKIPDVKERKRLKRILTAMKAPEGMGVIVRTAGVGKTKAALQRDLDYLLGVWEAFGQRLRQGRGPVPLYQESDVAIRTVRDLFDSQTKEVIVDDPTVHEQLKEFAHQLMPEHEDRIRLHDGDRPLFHHYGIEQDFEKIFARRVELPSGGSIVFDQTEALVAIDVNSGRTRTDGFDFEEIALKTNMEAVPEIGRQIRLRDLGGIIVCDFIDMMRTASMRSVERALRNALVGDRARSKLGRISQFGLLEMTRQRLGPGTHKKVFQACPRCRGTARIRSVPSRAAAIIRRLGSALTQKGFSKIEVRAHPEVVDYLKSDLDDYVRALEHRFDRDIELTGVPDQPEDSVLRYLRADGREVRPGGRRKR
ncbi:MAG: ribonuclease E [Planctomycetota bacterium]|jgi:ribonuclease E